MFVSAALFAPNSGASQELTGQEASKIEALLASLNCRVVLETVERRDEDYVLKDVFCADGQFNIILNSLFKVIAKEPT